MNFKQVNGISFHGLFHNEVVQILRELSGEVRIVCARKVTGSSPLRGTIVNNVDTGKTVQAFASRVSKYVRYEKTPFLTSKYFFPSFQPRQPKFPKNRYLVKNIFYGSGFPA